MSDSERKELIRLRKENERLCMLLEEALKGNAELREQLKELQEKLDILLVRMNKRNRKDFGNKTERHNPRPALEGVVEARRKQPSSSEGDAPSGIKHILNQAVDEVPVQHSVCGANRFCPTCCVETVFVGNNISHQLEKLASTIHKLRHLQEVRSCPKCKTYMVTAEKPCPPIPGSYAGPGLLADTIVGKFGDGLPLNRKSKMFKRESVVIPRSTQSDWIIASSLTVEPLYELLKREVLCSAIIQTDDSELKVQDRKHKRKMRKGKITVYRGDRDHRYIVFDFSGDKSFERNKLFFEDFQGIVQADAAIGFDSLFADGTKIEAGCNAHARRRFFDCLPIETKLCNEILDLYDEIYKIEKRFRKASDADRLRARQEQSRPLFTKLLAILQHLADTLNPSNPLMEAASYTLRHWNALTRFLDDPRIEIDNNASEREIKDFVLARKNFLFAGSDRGGKAAAIHMSLIASCKRAGINPVEYLTDVFKRINTMKTSELHQLLPDRWAHERRQRIP